MYADITERKRAEDELTASEHKFRSLFNSMSEGVAVNELVLDAEGNVNDYLILDVNPALEANTPYKAEQMVGKRATEVYQLSPDYIRNWWQQHVAMSAAAYTELYHEPSRRWFAITTTRLVGNRFYTVSSDITERKRADSMLRESREALVEAQTIARIGSWEYDLATNKATWSDQMFDLFGRDPGLGEPSWQEHRSYIHPDDWDLLDASLTAASAEGVPYSIEFRLAHPTRGERWGWTIGQPVRDASGKVVKLKGTVQDVTERKQAEDALRQRLAELEALSRLSAALRSTVSLQEMLDMLLDETLAVIGASAGGIWLHDAASGQLHPATVRGWFTQIRDRVIPSTEGVAGESFSSGQTVVSREFKSDPRTNTSAREQAPEGWGGACVPLQTADQVAGLLFCSVQLPRQLGAQEVGLLNTLAAMAGNAIHRKRLHDQTERQLLEAEGLRDVDRAVAANFDLTVTLGRIVKHATELLGVDAAGVLLPNAYELRYAAWNGFRSHDFARIRMRVTGSLAGRAVTERRMITVENLAQEANPAAFPRCFVEEGLIAYCAVPIIAKGAVKGILEILQRVRVAATPHWLDLLSTLAGQAAIAIDNADLFEGLQKSNAELTVAYDATIEGWSRALDLRDKETEGHSRRVTEVTMRLASLMGLPDADLVHIRRGALLHDIGKLGVPDQILLKPGTLTADEWAIMRRHPQMAFDLLSGIAYLRPSLDIPYCHHEKWDGTGYPCQLAGEDIPLPARLFAIADVTDALRSDRPYRPAWPAAKIHEYLRQQSGLHFEPQVVAMFLAMDTP